MLRRRWRAAPPRLRPPSAEARPAGRNRPAERGLGIATRCGPDWGTYIDAGDVIGDTAEAFAATAFDSCLWTTLVSTGGYGPEILSLAARDLIGRAPGWTPAVSDLITRPWSEAFGPAHPGDAIPPRPAAVG